MISVLCIQKKSNYRLYPDLDLWDAQRDAYNFKGSNPVITHAPCAQWCRLRNFAKDDPYTKGLAQFCFDIVVSNGGIFEHPADSLFLKSVTLPDHCKLYEVEGRWFGFPARKRTWLVFSKCKPATMPMNFDMVQYSLGRRRLKKDLPKSMRSETPIPMIDFFIDSLSSIR